MLKAMQTVGLLIFLAVSIPGALGQTAMAPAFDVASVRQSQHTVGPDYNNQLTYGPTGVTARNATIKRLVADAYGLQMDQVSGPAWLDQNEYDIDTKTTGGGTKEQMGLMLRSLLAERFHLTQHGEMREMRVYELIVEKSGSKIRPVDGGEPASAATGFHFHGDLRQFADLLAVQLSIPASDNPGAPVRASTSRIPVVDKTGMPGVFDFSVDIHPELGTDMFATWKRALRDQLGLNIESRKESVAVLIVDQALKIPTPN